MSETENQNEALKAIVHVFKQHFAPATNVFEAEHQFTTQEIMEAIANFAICDMTGLFQIMVDAGFKYMPVSENEGLKFVWLLKSSSPAENQA